MRESRSHWWMILVVCGVACCTRLGMLAWRGQQLGHDVDAYLQIGRHLAEGSGFSIGEPPHPTAFRPVLLPVLIAGIFHLGGSPIVLGIVHVLLGVMTTALTYRVGQLLQLGTASIVAAGLVAIDPLLLQNTVLPMTETLCATLVILWCWVVFELTAVDGLSRVRQLLRAALHGACFGFICLCRPAFLAVAGVVLLWMCFKLAAEWRRGPLSTEWRRIVLPLLASGIGMGVVLAPWTIRNAVVIGKGTPATTHGGYTLLLGNNPTFYHEVMLRPWGTVWEGDSLFRWQRGLEVQMANEGIRADDEVARDRWMYRQAYSHINSEPLVFLRACVWRAVRFWDVVPRSANGQSFAIVWGSGIFYSLVTAGIFIALFRLNPLEWKMWSLVALLPLTLWITHWFYWTDMRMRAPVVPLLALFAARAFVSKRTTTLDASPSRSTLHGESTDSQHNQP